MILRTRKSSGFTVVELLIVVAIVGVLAAVGFISLPRDEFAVRQAAEGLARDVQLARFEAITRNTYIEVFWDVDADTYEVRDIATGETLKVVGFGRDTRTQRIAIASVADVSARLVFDPRGVGIGTGGTQVVTLASTRSDASTDVSISQQGRTAIE